MAQKTIQTQTLREEVSDFFKIGDKVGTYTIVDKERISVLTVQQNGKHVPVIIEALCEWINYIRDQNYDRKTNARKIRDEVKLISKYSAHLHAWESHYHNFAFTFIEANS